MAGRDAIPALIEATGVLPSTAAQMREVGTYLNTVASGASSLFMGGADMPELLGETMKLAKQVGKGAAAPAPTPE